MIKTGEIFLEGGVELTSENLNELKQAKVRSIEVVNQIKISTQ